ncbi:ArsR/SmtB family transcription factor [Kitasatospora sp. NPDC127111]|uniref:ArsR/SmtB family transcription factor n=1 Tax=Kitasatospora sp. NPDC127111 TaxID=3345363 RepID=UPI0036306D8A
MHLVPADRTGHRTIDGHRVCEAIAAIGDTGHVRSWAERFSLLADPGRLSLLLALHRAGPLAVTDLAVATGMRDPAVSQALRLLRTAGVVTGDKDGRVVRYRLVDEALRPLLDECAAAEHHEPLGAEPDEPLGADHHEPTAAVG